MHLSTNGSYFPFSVGQLGHLEVQKVISAWVMTNINGYNKLLLETLITKKNRLILGGFYTKKSIIKWHFPLQMEVEGIMSPHPSELHSALIYCVIKVFFFLVCLLALVELSCRLLVFFALLLHSFSCSY